MGFVFIFIFKSLCFFMWFWNVFNFGESNVIKFVSYIESIFMYII